MQPDQHPPTSGKIAFRYGLIFGVGLFIIAAILVAIGNIALRNSLFGTILTGVYWLLGLVIFFLVGMFASQKTGKVSTGTLAGLWAGIFEGVLYAIFGNILFFTYTINAKSVSSTSSHFTSEAAHQILVIAVIVGFVLFGLASIGFGAGLGALGGLVGRATSKFKPSEQQLYPGQQPYLSNQEGGQFYSDQS